MPTVKFIGRIQPSYLDVTLTDILPVAWTMSTATGVRQLLYSLTIEKSEVIAKCELESFGPDDLNLVYARAHDYASSVIDLGAFATGRGMHLIFETFVDPSGIARPLVLLEKSLEQLCTAFKLPAATEPEKMELTEVLKIVLTDFALAKALNDLAHTLQVHHQVPTNCGRVLDGLRKIVAPDAKPMKGWRTLQEIVNCDENYMNWVSQQSTNPRHGDRSLLPPETVTKIHHRTWIIMNRYLEYRKRGSQPLPLTEFPLLPG